MSRIAALDLGSNSFHLLVAEISPRGVRRLVNRKIRVGLAEPVAETGALGEEACQRARDAVAELVAAARSTEPTAMHAVATDALRGASDGPGLVAELEALHELSVRVLDGREEADLSLRGMAAAVEREPGTELLGIDLGGGSVELALGDVTGARATQSLPLGPGRVAGRVGDPPEPEVLAALAEEITAATAALLHDAGELAGPVRVVGTAGTLRDLGRATLGIAGQPVPSRIGGLKVPRDWVVDAQAQLSAVALGDRLELPGVRPKRAAHLPTAGALAIAVLDAVGAAELILSHWGLREGVLIDAATRMVRQ